VRLTVLAGAVGYTAVVGFDGFFYYPDHRVYYTPDQFQLAFEDVTFRASDGVQLSGWWLPAAGQPKGTVVHFHGNAQNMTSHFMFVYWLPQAGYNLLVFDYRGYGKSSGRVTRAGTIRDGLAAIDYALARPDVDPQRLFVFGQSLGGAVAIVAAAQRPQVRAVAVDSTFSRYRRIAALHVERSLRSSSAGRLVSWAALSGEYDPVDFVGQLSPRPLFIIVSGSDQICFPELGRELFAAAKEPKTLWEVPGIGHTEALDLREDETRRRLIEFFTASDLPACQRP
jgi:uncharacterized protein